MHYFQVSHNQVMEYHKLKPLKKDTISGKEGVALNLYLVSHFSIRIRDALILLANYWNNRKTKAKDKMLA